MQMQPNEIKIKINFFQGEDENTLDKAAVNGGIYIFELIKKGHEDQPIPLYVGQSVYMAKRGGEHLFEMFKDPEYFGLDEAINDQNLTLKVSVVKTVDVDFKKTRTERETRLRDAELEVIKKKQPILQNSSNDRMLSSNKTKIVRNRLAALK